MGPWKEFLEILPQWFLRGSPGGLSMELTGEMAWGRGNMYRGENGPTLLHGGVLVSSRSSPPLCGVLLIEHILRRTLSIDINNGCTCDMTDLHPENEAVGAVSGTL